MAKLTGFDANEVPPAGDFSPIPAGEYVACIIDSDMENTKDRKGEFLKLEIEVLEGEYKGRYVWDRLNLQHDDAKVDQKKAKMVEIAKGRLSAICRAVNKMTPDDSVELHNIPMRIVVSIEPWNDNSGKVSNRVEAYKPINVPPTAQEDAEMADRLGPAPIALSQASKPAASSKKKNPFG